MAYDAYFMLLATNEKEAIKFVNGVMPADLVAEASKQNQIPAATTPLNCFQVQFGVSPGLSM